MSKMSRKVISAIMVFAMILTTTLGTALTAFASDAEPSGEMYSAQAQELVDAALTTNADVAGANAQAGVDAMQPAGISDGLDSAAAPNAAGEIAGDSNGASDGDSAAEEETEPVTYPDELIVGHPTITKGDFFTEMFGNDTADIDVRALIHGYNLVNWDQNQGVYKIDPTVVKKVEVEDDLIGNRTYNLTLQRDLFFSDGTHITAWDYAFTILLMMAKEIEQIGGKIYRAQHIMGYKDYITGVTSALKGVHVYEVERDPNEVEDARYLHQDNEYIDEAMEHIDDTIDTVLSITLDKDFLPYFFETGLLLCVPYPIYEIAPGCKVYDDGDGIYIGNEDLTIEEPIFTAELLRETILNDETGYNSHPQVVTGPYTMLSYDGVTGHFELNKYFKGAWVESSLLITESANSMNPDDPDVGGVMQEEHIMVPTIEKIAFTLADNNTMADDLAEGRLHLVNKVVYGPTIMECMGLNTTGMWTEAELETVEDEEETKEFDIDRYNLGDIVDMNREVGESDVTGVRFQNYPRIGLAFMTFSYEWPTVHDKEVRQAIAWCMDREALTQAYTKGFGMVVNGYYGIEQWEYQLVTRQIDYPVNFINDEEHDQKDYEKLKYQYVTNDEEYEAAIAAWELYTLDNLVEYEVDLDKANALLDYAGWTLNRDGEPYDPERDEVRCKYVDGELVDLDLTLMYPEGNHIIDTMQENFIDNLNEAGILLTLVPTPMEELLKSYYRETERTTDMIYLATNFHVIVDPSITYSTDDTVGHQVWNNTYSDDEDLYYRAVNMRMTDPGDIYDYVGKWISFQERYNEVLPTIPIYSNIYFDFYTSMLQNYHITAHVTWSQAILESYWGEEETTEEETTEEDLGDAGGAAIVEFDD